jgi:hypothetical protein
METLALTLTPHGTRSGLKALRIWLERFDRVDLSPGSALVHLPMIGTILIHDDRRMIHINAVAPDSVKANYIQGWFSERVASIGTTHWGRVTVDSHWSHPKTAPSVLVG